MAVVGKRADGIIHVCIINQQVIIISPFKYLARVPIFNMYLGGSQARVEPGNEGAEREREKETQIQ